MEKNKIDILYGHFEFNSNGYWDTISFSIEAKRIQRELYGEVIGPIGGFE